MQFKDNKIIFSSPLEGAVPPPKPSSHFIPEVFKKFKTAEYPNDTVKACMPFLDSLTSGYIIPLPVSIKATSWIQDGKSKSFKININERLNGTSTNNLLSMIGISDHPPRQIPESMVNDNAFVKHTFKLHNPWTIKTPPGYSCIFTQPLNRNSPWKIIDGIVDTDSYDGRINFPFYWMKHLEVEESFNVDAGVPMVQVIPFKRESWKMEIQAEYEEKKRTANVLTDQLKWLKLNGLRFKDWYKLKHWKKKSYK